MQRLLHHRYITLVYLVKCQVYFKIKVLLYELLSFDFERLVEFPIVKVDGGSKASAKDHVTRPLDRTEVKSELYSSHAIVVKPA